jgi:hypothetical protein
VCLLLSALLRLARKSPLARESRGEVGFYFTVFSNSMVDSNWSPDVLGVDQPSAVSRVEQNFLALSKVGQNLLYLYAVNLMSSPYS